MKIKFFILCLLVIHLSNLESANEYITRFQGIEEPALLSLVESASQLSCLQTHPPQTSAALRRRADGDIANLKTALQSQGYYSPDVDINLNFEVSPIAITITLHPGPLYAFGNIRLLPENFDISPEMLGIEPGKPALPSLIVQAEDTILELLIKKGYALASLQHREVTSDDEQRLIHVIYTIESGPQTSFGESEILGLDQVEESFVRNKICWKDGEPYSPEKVDKTIQALESSHLFSSINITHSSETDLNGRLPMIIQVAEGKPRSIGFGIGYSTQRGPGITGEWEHRNLRGKGDRFRFATNLQWESQDALVSYMIPDVGIKGQDLLWKLEGQHDLTEGFEDTSVSFSGTLERQLNTKMRLSYGAMYKWLHINNSDNNGDYHLLKSPVQIKWSEVDIPLDPTSGYSVYFKTEPSLQVCSPQFGYLINTLSGTYYYSLNENKSLILAAKGTIGSIWGSSRHAIPPSERFYGGSETMLRGYKYMTVSPLDAKHKPVGGRSLMAGSLEARWRPTDKWGGVLFYDVGNVYSSPTPSFGEKLLQSVGAGLRYFTPIAPLRLDVAFPLNRRKFVDPGWQIYFSIGQSF